MLLEEQATLSLVQSTVDSLESYLLKMAGLPMPESRDSNPSTITILTARLNTKVLAAKVIALRPYLMMVLKREHADISDKTYEYMPGCEVPLGKISYRSPNKVYFPVSGVGPSLDHQSAFGSEATSSGSEKHCQYPAQLWQWSCH